MILVTVGSSSFAFDRLVRAVETLPDDEDIVVQHGPSGVRPPRATCRAFLPFTDLAALVGEARVVVTHAGVGSILLALSSGKRPIVVPRLRSFRETVDDHQLESARRFAREGLVTVVEDATRLARAVADANTDAAPVSPRRDVPLIDELRAYIRETVTETGASA